MSERGSARRVFALLVAAGVFIALPQSSAAASFTERFDGDPGTSASQPLSPHETSREKARRAKVLRSRYLQRLGTQVLRRMIQRQGGLASKTYSQSSIQRLGLGALQRREQAEALQHSPASSVQAISADAVIPNSGCAEHSLAGNDDGSTEEVALPFTLNFYGLGYNSLWVNNNGNVTFEGPMWTYTPFDINAYTPPIIAPFFADVDTRVGNLMTYGDVTYEGHPAFCIDWPDVGYYAEHTDKLNDFQLLLVNRNDVQTGDFDIIFNYNQLQWETGDASGGIGGLGGTSAAAGFSSGNGAGSYFVSLPGSLQNGAFLDNASTGLVHHSRGSAQLGRYIFQVRPSSPNFIEQGGAPNRSERQTTCSTARPVNCATGVFWHEFTDASIPGLGVPLEFTRTYSSMNAGTDGPLGFGWTDTYNMSLTLDEETGAATIHEEGGSAVTFPADGEGGFTTPPRVLATLTANEDGTYTFLRYSDHIQYVFSEDGRLLREIDRNGNTTTLSYAEGLLKSVTDPSGRSLALAYTGSRIHTVTDPMGRTTTFGYDVSGNLKEATDPMGRKWAFTYDSEHRLLSMTDPRGGSTTNTYNSSGRVIAQVDPMGRESTWSYEGDPASPEGGATVFTDARGDETLYEYQNLELIAVTHGYGSEAEATASYHYDPTTLGVSVAIDPNGGETYNTYDSHGNLVSTTDPLGRTAYYEYGSEDELLEATDPAGTTTTYAYDEDGNLLEKETPLEGTGEVALTSYSYEGAPGELTAVTDPDGYATHFGYDANGNRASVTDANGNETTYAYNADGEQTSKVSPVGNEAGGNPAAHTTSYAYDADGELTSETDQLGHATSYAYDGNRNRASVTDANGHKTKQIYDADNELVEVVRPNGSVLKTEWDAAGNMTAQIDGAGHTTAYAYDPLNRLTSTTDPDGRTTTYAYDPAGNKVETINAEGESTYYEYDEANELVYIEYSDGTTPSVYVEYDEDGNRIWLEDGTGESSFSYDSLNRMTSATDGAGATVGYEYDLAGRLLSLTYPNGKTVARKYDPAGNLTSVADWLGHTTKFSYSANSNLEKELYPNGVETQREYDNADRLASITDAKGATQLAALNYTRNAVGQLASESAENGENQATSFTRNSLDQLTAANTTPYGYDNADNPTTFGGETTQQFDPANELTSVMSPEEGGEEEPGGEEKEEGKEEPEEKGGGKEQGGGSKEPPEERERPVEPPTVDAKSAARLRKPGKLVSRKLHVQQGDLLIAFVSAAGNHQHVRRVNGGGLHWSRVARQGGAGGISEAWQARTSRAFSGRVTVTLTRKTRLATAAIAAFGNDAIVAAHTAGHGRHSVPLDQVNAPAGALLWGVGHSFGQSRPPAPAPGQSVVSRFFSRRAGLSGWVQNADGAAGAAALSTRSRASRWSLLGLAVTSAAQAGASRATASPSGGAHSATATRPVASAASIVTRDFSYNERGDRVAEEVAEGAARSLAYDQADRLVGVNGNVEYGYNGDSLRTSKTVNGVTTSFVWNQAEALPELLQDGSTYYVYGPEDQPVEQITGTTPTYLHGDQQGSTRLLTDGSGNVTGRYDYNPWGSVAAHSGSATTNLQYDGQYTDGETGYQYLRARYYDPATGQFLSQDPAFTLTRSRYAFTLNDPLDYFDPTGLGLCLLGHNPNGSCRGGSEAVTVTKGFHVVTGAVAVGATACAGVAAASIIGNLGVSEACTVGALAAGGLSLASGELLYATGYERTSGLIVDTLGVVPVGRLFGRLNRLVEVGIGIYGTVSSIADWNYGPNSPRC